MRFGRQSRLESRFDSPDDDLLVVVKGESKDIGETINRVINGIGTVAPLQSVNVRPHGFLDHFCSLSAAIGGKVRIFATV